MIKRIILLFAAIAIISISSTAEARYPFRSYRYYAPAPVVRHYAYRPPIVGYYAPYPSYYSYRYPGSYSYYAPSVHSYYAPSPAYVVPYGGVSVAAPGVSVRIGF